MNEQITEHLNTALRHLQDALKLSVEAVLRDARAKNPIGSAWERFIYQFFSMVRSHSKESKLNLLSWLSLSKLLKG